MPARAVKEMAVSSTTPTESEDPTMPARNVEALDAVTLVTFTAAEAFEL